jgi:hypothetical protein
MICPCAFVVTAQGLWFVGNPSLTRIMEGLPVTQQQSGTYQKNGWSRTALDCHLRAGGSALADDWFLGWNDLGWELSQNRWLPRWLARGPG